MKNIIGVLLLCYGINAHAGFGPTVVVDNVKADRIFTGTGVVYVTFSGGALNGCSGNVGGYVTASWSVANGGSDSPDKTNRFVSLFLYAKSQSLPLEVRYRVNDAGTGWDECAIDAIFLH